MTPERSRMLMDIPGETVNTLSGGHFIHEVGGRVAALCTAQGIGIAVLPQVVGQQVGGLRRLQLPQEPPARDIWMGYHRDLRRLNRLRAFIATVNDHFAGLQS